MTTTEPIRIYTDGGVWKQNPSPVGGACAYRIVVGAGEVLAADCLPIYPATVGVPAVSNNNTELLAIVMGMQKALDLKACGLLDPGGSVRVCSDSIIALGWVFEGFSLRSVPRALQTALAQMQERRQSSTLVWSHELLAGHPTDANLAAGYMTKRSGRYPVSEHNVWCDRQCQETMRRAFAPAPTTTTTMTPQQLLD